jgi:uncharacterized phage protein gp47/JayE
MAKTVEEVRSEMIAQLNRLLPTLDLSVGSPERDIFIEAPLAGAIYPMWKQIGLLESIFSLFSNPDSIPTAIVDKIAADNYNVRRTPASPAFGTATFYATAFNETITIPAGTTIQTASSTPKVFTTISSAVFNPQDAALYFNSINSRYEFKVAIKSQNTGSGTGVSRNTLTVLTSPIPGITGVTNDSGIDDGFDAETNSQVVAKIQQANISRSIDTNAGLNIFLSKFSNDYRIIRYGDKDFKRSKFPGGVDVYFANITPESATETFVVPNQGFTGGFIFSNQPVLSINVVTGSTSGLIPEEIYNFVKDKGLLSNSTRSKDAIVFKSPGINDSTVTVTYTYNSFPSIIEAELALPSNDTFNRDILARQATEVLITVEVGVRLQVGAEIEFVQNAIITNLSAYINGLALGQSVLKSDVLSLLRVDGVAAIDFNTFKMKSSGGGSVNSLGDIEIANYEFPVFSDAVITPI